MNALETLDVEKLTTQVKDMYTAVANAPHERYHFEMGRSLALKLGYPADILDRIPNGATESFAGVGFLFSLLKINQGDFVIDLGSGSGMDAFYAAELVGPYGKVIGIDMTEAQLKKSYEMAKSNGYVNVEFEKSMIERIPLEGETVDVVISNGVINLCANKLGVFNEIFRVLNEKGQMAISDIVTEHFMPESITCNPDLWAACIGGAMQIDEYLSLIENAGLQIKKVTTNSQYGFISSSAQGASGKYGVKSISVLAEKI